MDIQQLTYAITRHYLNDNLPVLGEELYRKLSGYLRARDISKLSSALSLVDMHSHDVDRVRALLQVEAFFKKNASFADDDLCSLAARASFEKNERICRITNRRLDYFYAKRDRLDPDLSFWLSKMERTISRCLGPFSEFLNSIPELVRVTAGATSTDSRRDSAPHRKMKLRYRCPSAGIPYLRAVAKFFGYPAPRCIVSAVNRVEVVPKSWKTHRTIACEPDGALPFQLAFDTWCKKRLRRLNVDLRFQDRNQEEARVASVDGSLATIDLAAASDTVAFNTVAWLFPVPWFKYLNAFRSTHYKGSFGMGNYAKFSSMGNGSTFVVETLVFTAACLAVGSRRYSVYGDDIIIETELVDDLLRLLKFLGFSVNLEKSFTTGRFRESCGAFWLGGVDVKPFYIRGSLKRKPELCHVINGLASIALPGGELWRYLLNFVKEERLMLVPWSEDSTLGIWIEPYHAYRRRLIRGSTRPKGRSWHQRGVLSFRAYVNKHGLGRYIGNSQTLALWYLRRYQQKHASDSDPLVCSRETHLTHRYERKWVCWFPPARLSPGHLWWWSEDLLATLGE